jgi:hypothetical protein
MTANDLQTPGDVGVSIMLAEWQSTWSVAARPAQAVIARSGVCDEAIPVCSVSSPAIVMVLLAYYIIMVGNATGAAGHGSHGDNSPCYMTTPHEWGWGPSLVV